MDKKNFAFDKTNFILLAIGMAIVVAGFVLMSGGGSTETVFSPDIFSVRRIKVAPVVCLFGFLFIIYAILHRPADSRPEGGEPLRDGAETLLSDKDKNICKD